MGIGPLDLFPHDVGRIIALLVLGYVPMEYNDHDDALVIFG